jgi:3-isopropylmalate dehydratase small subunit
MAAVTKNRNFFNCPLLLAGLSDTILKGTHPGTIPARFGLIWFSGFRGEDLNAIFGAWQPSWLEVGITGHNFGRGSSRAQILTAATWQGVV